MFNGLTAIDGVARHGAVISDDAGKESNGLVDLLWKLLTHKQKVAVNQENYILKIFVIFDSKYAINHEY